MKFDLETHAALRIHAYASGEITLAVPGDLQLELAVDPETGLCQVTESLILTGRHVITEWEPNQLPELTAAHMEVVLSLDPELVLLGTGARQQFPAMDILTTFHRAQIGIEVMDTAAACRTFNILVAEGRHVAAALLMI
ncbi:MAG: MTH938/NDUFAF3 family protein [Gammaproteobacteria bacterium]|nr:MTH938/NDUFAF3 family protein [Gammaproteobacteria bacterium]